MIHFREVCRSTKGRVAHNVGQEPYQNQEEGVKVAMVNINSNSFNSKHSMITENLKTSNKVVITVPYKVDTISDGNIMPLHIYRKLFPRATNEQLWQTEMQYPVKNATEQQ